MMTKARITDPVEQIIAETLRDNSIEFIHDSQGGTNGLDFYLPNYDTYIECKRFHSQRIADQMARVESVIAIQGMAAANFFSQHFGEIR